MWVAAAMAQAAQADAGPAVRVARVVKDLAARADLQDPAVRVGLPDRAAGEH